jgi:hypothetical protein
MVVENIRYDGSYGIDHAEIRYDSKHRPYTHFYTDWYPISGTVKRLYYNPGSKSSRISLQPTLYAGYTYPSELVEKVVNTFDYRPSLTECHDLDNHLDTNTKVDAFLMRSSTARGIIRKRLREYITDVIEADARKRTKFDHLDIRVTDYKITQSKIYTVLFPAYILQYDYSSASPQIMAAVRHHEVVSGSPSIAPSKAMMFSVVPSVALSLLFPGTLMARTALSVTIVLVTGVGSRYIPSWMRKWNRHIIDEKKHQNDLAEESTSDRARRILSERFICYAPLRKRREAVEKEVPMMDRDQVIYNVNPNYFYLLGLSPYNLVTEKIVREAFLREIQKCHPDLIMQHSAKVQEELRCKAAQVVVARDVLLEVIHRNR